MTLPTPQDMAQAPAWENYVMAQAVTAMLGKIPRPALTIGVQTRAEQVVLIFQLARLTDEARADIEEIVEDLEVLLGDEIEVSVRHEVVERPTVDPAERIGWIYRVRLEEPQPG